jgi:enoyl-CoA hydratase/carnithine racemase
MAVIIRLVATLGLARTLDIVLTGRKIEAKEALRIGLVSAVVAPNELQSTAESYARRIMQNSQAAVRSAKETILEVLGRPLDDALRLEAIYGYTSGDPTEITRRLDEFFASHGRSAQARRKTRKSKA